MSISVQIKKTLGNFTLDVAFEADNQVLSLLGGSGCGKSMTLRCIAGIEKPDWGKIVVNGVTYFDSEKKINLKPQKRKVGMLFQNYALFPNMTVEENILTGLAGVKDKTERRRRLAEAIVAYHLEGLEKKLPYQLSGGQQQRVALARILVSEPAILLLDEPFSALDSYLKWEMEQELKSRLQDFPGTTVFVSHSREEVFRLSDRIAVYNNGKIDVEDTRDGVFQSPRTWQAALLTGCKNLSEVTLNGNVAHSEEWALDLTIPEGAAPDSVGIRAHAIRRAEQPGVNVFRYETVLEEEDTFNIVRFIKPAGTQPKTLIRWALPKELAHQPETGLVEFPQNALMLLKK